MAAIEVPDELAASFNGELLAPDSRGTTTPAESTTV